MNTIPAGFYEMSRQNTGSALCDSGTAYGYHYARSMDKPSEGFQLVVDKKLNEVLAYISLPYFLSRVFTIEKSLTQAFYDFANQESNKDKCWIELFEEFAKNRGFNRCEGDNSYNHDNDLNQDFQYHCAYKNGEEPYEDRAIYMVQTHNGCDIRGGYSNPLICVLDNYEDWCNLCSWTVGWRAIEGETWRGQMDENDLEELGQEYEQGYSDAPTYRLNRDIEKVVSADIKRGRVKVKFKTGETVVFVLDPPSLEY